MRLAFQKIGFQLPANQAEDDPVAGLERTLHLIAYGEALGYDAAWVPQRQGERGLSSAVTLLAAASQRTRRIGLGTAVLPLETEPPYRLAEDLATLDLLTLGRLNVGISALVGGQDGTRDEARALSFARALCQEPASTGAAVLRFHPAAQGIAQRLWYGCDQLQAAEVAGRNGWHVLAGSRVRAEDTDDFATAQAALIARHRAAWSAPHAPRLSVGRVILPLDNASWSLRRRSHELVAQQKARKPGPDRQLHAPILIGTSDDILHALARDPVASAAQELRLELPQDFPHEDIVQIVEDISRLLPTLRNWTSLRPAISA